jgi:hypothetical protein
MRFEPIQVISPEKFGVSPMAPGVGLWVNGPEAGPWGVARGLLPSFPLFRCFAFSLCRKRGGAPGEFAVFGKEDGIVNKLWVTALVVMALALAPGPPASAQSAVEYGGLVSKNQGGSTLGKSVGHKIGSAKQKGSWHKRKKSKG